MKSKFSIHDCSLAMLAMLEVLRETATIEQIQNLIDTHDCIYELDEHGINGPAALGIGVYGGHAVDPPMKSPIEAAIDFEENGRLTHEESARLDSQYSVEATIKIYTPSVDADLGLWENTELGGSTTVINVDL